MSSNSLRVPLQLAMKACKYPTEPCHIHDHPVSHFHLISQPAFLNLPPVIGVIEAAPALQTNTNAIKQEVPDNKERFNHSPTSPFNDYHRKEDNKKPRRMLLSDWVKLQSRQLSNSRKQEEGLMKTPKFTHSPNSAFDVYIRKGAKKMPRVRRIANWVKGNRRPLSRIEEETNTIE